MLQHGVRGRCHCVSWSAVFGYVSSYVPRFRSGSFLTHWHCQQPPSQSVLAVDGTWTGPEIRTGAACEGRPTPAASLPPQESCVFSARRVFCGSLSVIDANEVHHADTAMRSTPEHVDLMMQCRCRLELDPPQRTLNVFDEELGHLALSLKIDAVWDISSGPAAHPGRLILRRKVRHILPWLIAICVRSTQLDMRL